MFPIGSDFVPWILIRERIFGVTVSQVSLFFDHIVTVTSTIGRMLYWATVNSAV